MALFGLAPVDGGSIRLDGDEALIRSAAAALRAGAAVTHGTLALKLFDRE